MKLQILVPQYKETEKVIKHLLDSIEIQQGVDLMTDVGVIIVNDGSGLHLSRSFLNQYTFPIEYYLEPHKGIAATRNTALSKATADYIIFCDSDDMFCSAIALSSIFRVIDKQDGFDELICYFYAEVQEGIGSIVYEENTRVVHPFIHGKVFKHSFLKDNNIIFDEKLQYHEDVYFAFLAHSCAKNIKMLPQFTYIWKISPTSVTRQTKNFSIKHYAKSLDAIESISNELLRRGLVDNARYYYICCVCNTYIFMHGDEWTALADSDYAKLTVERFKIFWANLGNELFVTAKKDNIDAIFEDTKKEALRKNTSKTEYIQEDLYEWISRITGEKIHVE